MSKRTPPTAHITTGPFFPAQFIRAEEADLTRGGEAAFTLTGRITDARGNPCVCAIIEMWQADEAGTLGRWGRTWTDKEGLYRFRTIQPGAVGHRAPCIQVTLHASGLMRPLVTPMFFPGEALNDTDPQLELVPSARRGLLIARSDGDGALRFDIAFGGPDETPFLED